MDRKMIERFKRSLHDGGQRRGSHLLYLDRLKRWAELLERQGERPLNVLRESEGELDGIHDGMRLLNSAISVAYADSGMRSAGLGLKSTGSNW